VLCRLALKGTLIDAGTFTLARVASAAVTLWLIMLARRTAPASTAGGNWIEALGPVIAGKAR